MRKTRLVILPTKCLHQMGFLLLFLSCPVIGDWGRIRPESETLHKAIQIDREGTCGLQRDPPGGLVDFLDENGSDQCRLSEDSDLKGISKKAILEAVRRTDERRVDTYRTVRERSVRAEERKDVRRATRRIVDERRDAGRESRRDVRRERFQVRSRSVESRRSREVSPRRLREDASRERLVVPELRNERERLHQTRRMEESQTERRTRQQRRFVRETAGDRRENERTVRETRERLSRSMERQEFRGDNNRRSLRERSLRRRESQTRERSQDRQNERLSLARREQRKGENSERRLSQPRKAHVPETRNEVVEQRRTRNLDTRRGMDMRQPENHSEKPTERDVRGGRLAEAFHERMMDKMKFRRVTSARKHENLGEEIGVKAQYEAEDEFSGGKAKWLDLKKFENFKAGDWTTNCVIGAVVYFFSRRQIKAV